MKPSWKCLVIGIAAAAVLSIAVPQANAQWWGVYRPAAWGCCYTPSYSCYSPCYATVGCYTPSCYDSCGWYLGWRPGPIRRLLLGRYRWYWGGCWSSCCSSCDVCGSSVCEGCTGATTAPSAPTPAPTPAQKPVEPAMPAEPAAPTPPPPAEPSAGMSAAESGFLTIWVPYDAKVTVNGLETKSTGSRRQFVSYGLKPGFSYKYEVKATVVRNGQTVEDNRTVILTAGEITAVAFGFNVSSQQVASAN